MHLTPNQRSEVVDIYNRFPTDRSVKRAKVTVELAALQQITISEKGVRDIINEWNLTSIFIKLK
jgi:hypothetical protein